MDETSKHEYWKNHRLPGLYKNAIKKREKRNEQWNELK